MIGNVYVKISTQGPFFTEANLITTFCPIWKVMDIDSASFYFQSSTMYAW